MPARRFRRFLRPGLWLAAVCFALAALGARAQAQGRFVYVTAPDRYIVTPVLSQWYADLIARAERDGAEALVIQLDTPGGLLEATRDIVKAFLTAKVPVFVYVAPSGSSATSAGTFITVAAHVAAMAPSTHIGAAHPVDITGNAPDDEPRRPAEPPDEGGDMLREILDALKKASEEQKQAPAEEPAAGEERAADQPADVEAPPAAAPAEPESEPAPAEREQQQTGRAMEEKILNDTIAWARTVAETRHRNADWVEAAIVESASITEREALEEHVVDYVATDVRDLLEQADGREVTLASGRVLALETADAEIRTLNMSPRYRILGALAHPQILILLLSLGGLGLTMELFNPNGITGVIGAICLILAYFGTQTLPINYAGILLMLLALVLIIAEVKVVSYGLLTLGAVVCFTLGGLMLIDSPVEALRVGLHDVLPISAVFGAIAAFLVALVIRSQRSHVVSGEEGMVGLTGRVTKAIDPRGQVEVHGELWTALSDAPLGEGTAVRVVRIDGLTLTVEPVGAPPPADAPAPAATSEEGNT